MARCSLCGENSPLIAGKPGVCLACIRGRPHEALSRAGDAHRMERSRFGLPEEPPREPGGVPCRICLNECRIPAGEIGYCGLRRNEGRRLTGVSPAAGKFSWYHDPLPTNCVADWVCPGGTGAGYPNYACRKGPERKYKNLAVFFEACSFDCLSCQNWSFRRRALAPGTSSVEELLAGVDGRTSCICFFGGDPAPQLPFAIRASRRALEGNRGKILRICWETNGSMNAKLLDRMVELSLLSGGCIKFDLKAWDEYLHVALAGVSNRRTFENFRRVGARMAERPDPPLLIASTLLVPGYIDADEVGKIARFISSVDPCIPYSLLGFAPQFAMTDLPTTSRALAGLCLDAARDAGLKRVRIGNEHLLC